MSVTIEQITEVLGTVNDPELHRPITELKMVSGIEIDEGVVEVSIDLTIPGCPLKVEIDDAVTSAVASLDGVTDVRVFFGVMSEEQRAELRQQLQGSARSHNHDDHGHSHGDRQIPFSGSNSKTRVLLISSGKGGVGKSSVTTNLAVSFAQTGKKVAVIDADVWGFSIPAMLGIESAPTVIDDMIIPPSAHGVACVSMGFFIDEAQPVIWRGPMLHKALEQFLVDVYWDSPDYLLIDLPPGTGDIALSLAQFLPNAEQIVVTTPQPAAQRVAQRAGHMANKVGIGLLGVIENMSWFEGDDGKRYELFGAGGGDQLAADLDVPLLGQIPLTQSYREGADVGRPEALSDPNIGTVFSDMVALIDEKLVPVVKKRTELKLVDQ